MFDTCEKTRRILCQRAENTVPKSGKYCAKERKIVSRFLKQRSLVNSAENLTRNNIYLLLLATTLGTVTKYNQQCLQASLPKDCPENSYSDNETRVSVEAI
jgi:hypothetical protein